MGASLRSASSASAEAISEIEPTGPRSSWAARDTKSVRALSVRRSELSRWLRRRAWPTSMAVSFEGAEQALGRRGGVLGEELECGGHAAVDRDRHGDGDAQAVGGGQLRPLGVVAIGQHGPHRLAQQRGVVGEAGLLVPATLVGGDLQRAQALVGDVPLGQLGQGPRDRRRRARRGRPTSRCARRWRPARPGARRPAAPTRGRRCRGGRRGAGGAGRWPTARPPPPRAR